jgi:hypothetical protein
MAGLKEFYCRSNETSLGSQFKWLEYTFKLLSTASAVSLSYPTLPFVNMRCVNFYY